MSPTQAPDLSDIAGLVLCGGEGRRMGGQDKGLASFRGIPLARRAAARLAPQVASMVLSANRHLDIYRSWGWPVVADGSDERLGPLAGLLAGLRAQSRPWLACVPCDCPFFPTDLVARLQAAVQVRGALAGVAAIADPADPAHPRVQPVFCLVHRDLSDDLQAALARGERRIGAWLMRHRAVPVAWDEAAAFGNANTVEDLERLEALGPPDQSPGPSDPVSIRSQAATGP